VKNLEACKELEVDAHVPDPQLRKRDVRFADAGRHRRSVDKRKERYKSKSRLPSRCLRNPNRLSRQVHVFYGKRPGSITDEMKRKIDTEKGRRIYSKRLGIVEPVEYSLMQEDGSVHLAGAYQGQHRMDALLPGS